MLDTERLLILAHIKRTEIYNGGSGISSALTRAVPTAPVISAHTAGTWCMLGFKKILILIFLKKRYSTYELERL